MTGSSPQSAGLPRRPWSDLPPDVVAILGAELEAIGDETIAAIGVEIAEYARPLEGRFGRNVRRGVEVALQRFVALAGSPGAADEGISPIYRELGAGEWREGRSLDALQAAYRVGARVAWRRLGAAATRAGVDAATLTLLAESIFAYIDELAGESVAGYAQAQAAAAGAREARRRALAELLLRDPPADEEALAAAAAEAGWAIPRELAVIALADGTGPAAGGAGALAGALDPGALATDDAVLLPDPAAPGRRAALERALAGRGAAVGPAVAPRAAARSLRWARATLALGEPGTEPGPARFADEHLVALVLAAGAEPLAALRERRLAALDALPPARRTRLAATLGAWLAYQGSAPAAAAALHLHPQTVRYRLAQLRELLGAQLEDPEARLELALALRAPAGAEPAAGARWTDGRDPADGIAARVTLE
jgi:hypothetical protein